MNHASSCSALGDRPRHARANASCVALLLGCLIAGALQADPGYTAKSGKISFKVGSSLPLVTVSGSSSQIDGGGHAVISENAATINDLRFEVDPKSFKTGISLRDEHMQEKVFAASDGSIPKITLKAETFQAQFNAAKARWEGTLKGELTMRGVTKPVSFQATAEKKGEGAVVSAEGTVKISEFGVKKISYSGATVDDEVAVTVSDLVVTP